MLRNALLLTVGLAFIPASAFAQGTDCPLHKRLGAQNAVQSAELSPITTSAPVIEAPQTSTPRQSVVVAPVPSPVVPAVRSVDDVPVVQVAQASTQVEDATKMEDSGKKVEIMTPSLHTDWNDILQSYVSVPDSMGLTHFDYAGLKANIADSAKLDGYIKSLEGMNPNTLTENEAIAFWANLYNAVTIDLVVQNYPLGSIRKAKTYNGAKVGGFTGPWKKTSVSVNGQDVSLDAIEHKILRVKYPSPYVHYMVNCASVGCPNLRDRAWEASSYESLRKDAASDYINSPRGVVVTSKGLKVSSIYKWFDADFGGSKDNVLKHIRAYANSDLAAAIDSGAKIVDYNYDWSVNE